MAFLHKNLNLSLNNMIVKAQMTLWFQLVKHGQLTKLMYLVLILLAI